MEGFGGWAREHVVTTEIHPCAQCGHPTRFAHADFQVPLHPGSCTAVQWSDYWWATGRTPEGASMVTVYGACVHCGQEITATGEKVSVDVIFEDWGRPAHKNCAYVND